jgi:hypothetical protein
MARSTTHHFSVFSLMSPFFSDPRWVTRGGESRRRWWERGHQRSRTLARGSPVEGDGDGGAPAWRGMGVVGRRWLQLELSSSAPSLSVPVVVPAWRGMAWWGAGIEGRAAAVPT